MMNPEDDELYLQSISREFSWEKRCKRVKRFLYDEQFCKHVPIEKLVNCTGDILDLKARDDLKYLVIYLWIRVTESQGDITAYERELLFKKISKLSNVEDYPKGIEALITTTSQGEKIESYSNDILKLLSEWITTMFERLDVLRSHNRSSFRTSFELRSLTHCFHQTMLLLTNMIRVKFHVFDEMAVSSMLANCIWICKNTTDVQDIELVFSLLNCLISHGSISSSVLFAVIEMLCRAKFGLTANSRSAQQIIDKLLKSTKKYETVSCLRKVLESSNDSSLIAQMGAVKVLCNILVDPPRFVYCTRGMLLEFMLQALDQRSSRLALEMSRSLYNALEHRSFFELLYIDEWMTLLDILIKISSSLPKSSNYEENIWKHSEPNIIESVKTYQLKNINLIEDFFQDFMSNVLLDKFFELLKVNSFYLSDGLRKKMLSVLHERAQTPYLSTWFDDQKLIVDIYSNFDLSYEMRVSLLPSFRNFLRSSPIQHRSSVFRTVLFPLINSLNRYHAKELTEKIFRLICDLSGLYPPDIFYEVNNLLRSFAHNNDKGPVQLAAIQAISSMAFYYVMLPEFKSILYEELVFIIRNLKIRRVYRVAPLQMLLQLRINSNGYCFLNVSPTCQALLSKYEDQWYNPFISDEALKCRDNKVRFRDLSFAAVFQRFPLKANTKSKTSKGLIKIPIEEWVSAIVHLVLHESDPDIVEYLLINFTNQLRSSSMFFNSPNALKKILQFLLNITTGKYTSTFNSLPGSRKERFLVLLSKVLSVLMVYKDAFPESCHEQFFQLLNYFLEKGEKTTESCIDILIINCYAMHSFSVVYMPKFFSLIMTSNISERSLVNFLRLLHVVSNNPVLTDGLNAETIQKICLFCLSIIRSRTDELDKQKGLVNPNAKVFSLYLISFSYYIISNIFLSCPLSDRPSLVSFLLSEFLRNRKSVPFEGYENVFYELLLRFTYSDERLENYNRDKEFLFDKYSKTWIYRGCVITINAQYEIGDFEMTIRRMSGTTIYRLHANTPDYDIMKHGIKEKVVSSEIRQMHLLEQSTSHIFMETILAPLDNEEEEPVLVQPNAHAAELIQYLDATHIRPVINIAVVLQTDEYAGDINTTVGWQLFYRLLESFGVEKKLKTGEIVYVWTSKTIEIVFRHVKDPERDTERVFFSGMVLIASDDLVESSTMDWESFNVPVIIKLSLDSHLDALKMFDTLFHTRLEIITTDVDISHQGYWKLDQTVSVSSIPPLLHSFLADIGLYQQLFENFAYVHPWLLRQQFIDELNAMNQKQALINPSRRDLKSRTFDFTLFL
ncbi:GTPase activating protein [Schizosaccharomyces cryophilus OY26]|uniref:GTPase activating protein n=1 Tax=Schizosaccharomyces cryophilus (strain OY26 / ATCC MYA-4695 / CBS 11777 / NBRC 106824 / NRRL Y48691) TaxID=653667 RepID=S9X6C8_SCHCR|nr:GTPase activating protein [Schizosaccharomyces cryophilus OY26]EPY52657.1 GTPase activating protein [Schizosaccharomyces cryophilus OY26]